MTSKIIKTKSTKITLVKIPKQEKKKSRTEKSPEYYCCY